MRRRKMRLIATMITLAAVMLSVNAEAQRRETGSDRGRTNKESRQYSSKKYNNQRADRNRRSYSNSERYSDSRKQNNAYRNSDKRYYKNDNRYHKNDKRYSKNDNRYHRNERSYHHKRDAHWDRHKHKSYYYTKKYGHKHYRYDRRYEYNHPRYGHVYKRFYSKPVRVRHHHHGDFYFYGGHYYRHHRGVGYVRVEFPSHLVFDYLPFECEQVWVGPNAYYQYGDMVFERCDHGFRLAPKIDIHISTHF
ncbi:hypothetical protein SAMN05216283_10574 [Sunxiuqinia elliptica]|uniref:Uncharacterized protein n=2 Tax=Sunxiuqinia elliptica TaxID=655355 RepID=A0A1I2I209_9BACT|nr:hypothetical protein SAMN05216283_10574 [Sunxiuqinia elliptica]